MNSLTLFDLVNHNADIVFAKELADKLNVDLDEIYLDCNELEGFGSVANYIIGKIYEVVLDRLDNDQLREFLKDKIFVNGLDSRIDCSGEMLRNEGFSIDSLSDNDNEILKQLNVL